MWGNRDCFYSLIKASDKTKFQYDILVQCPGQQEHIFQKQGCNIITIPYVDSKQYHSALADFFAKNKYQAVHCHMFPTMDIVLEEARKANILHCIAHSHNARTDVPYFYGHCAILSIISMKSLLLIFGMLRISTQMAFPSLLAKGNSNL